jgi:acetate kinase
MNVLSMNSGSSSVKYGLYEIETGAAVDKPKLVEVFQQVEVGISAQEAFVRVGALMRESNMSNTMVIAHRLVHGGKNLRQHCVIDRAVMDELENATVFAPLHLPNSIQLIREAQMRFPGVVQIACFDTTFHATMPAISRTLPIAQDLQFEGIQRYGFHGISCESIVSQLRQNTVHEFPPRLIIAHLGSGVSVTAVKDGKSVDTSMGLTPCGGVMMGTRSGDLDPGLLIYLMRDKGLSIEVLEHALNHSSGLLGISGLSSDMKKLHEAAALTVHPSHAKARLAIAMFCYSLRKQIAATIAVLEGIDLIVFTGGIGENDEEVRANICRGLAWVHTEGREVQTTVLASEEERQMARIAFRLMS